MSSKKFSETLRAWTEKFMTRSMREWVHFMKSSDLSMSQFQLLTRLYYQGVCGISEISAQWDITVPAASQMVDRLVQQNLLQRTEDPNDRRAKQVALSPKGRALIEKGIQARTRWLDDLAPLLTPEQQGDITDSLHHLLDAAEKLDPPAEKHSAPARS